MCIESLAVACPSPQCHDSGIHRVMFPSPSRESWLLQMQDHPFSFAIPPPSPSHLLQSPSTLSPTKPFTTSKTLYHKLFLLSHLPKNPPTKQTKKRDSEDTEKRCAKRIRNQRKRKRTRRKSSAYLMSLLLAKNIPHFINTTGLKPSSTPDFFPALKMSYLFPHHLHHFSKNAPRGEGGGKFRAPKTNRQSLSKKMQRRKRSRKRGQTRSKKKTRALVCYSID